MSKERRPTRVVHLDTVHPWDDVRIYHKECFSLAQFGYEVYLIACESATPPPSGGSVRVQTLVRSNSRSGRVPAQFRALRLCRRLKPDVVHFHSPELIPLMCVAKLFHPSWKIVFDMHENVVALADSRGIGPVAFRGLLRLGLHGLLRLSERVFDAVVIAEESYQEYLRNPAVMVRNYPIVQGTAGMDRSKHGETNERDASFRLVYFGSVSEPRGLRVMLEVVCLLREQGVPVHLDVLGAFATQADRNLGRRFCAEHHLERLVFFSDGRIPHEDGLRRIAAADIGLCLLLPDPNYIESLPTKLFEYMMMGVPAIVSDFPLWRAIVEDADCGRAVPPADTEAAACVIAELLEDAPRRERMGKNGYEAVRDTYCWENEEKKLLELYERILE